MTSKLNTQYVKGDKEVWRSRPKTGPVGTSGGPLVQKEIMKKFVIDNLLTRLNGDDGKLSNKFIKNLPNAKSYKIIMQGKEIPLTENTDIQKSVQSYWEIIPYKNRRMNRYFEYMIRRLVSQTGNPKVFWNIADRLNKRSAVWFVVHLNKVLPGWYRWLPSYYAPKLWKEMLALVTRDKGKVNYRRVYIPKVTTNLKDWVISSRQQWRPLGVPIFPWRVYLAMLNSILVIYLEQFWQKQQHGYFPQKGTLTCWREILKKIEKSPTVYEFDLKSFFPSVEIQNLSRVLREYKIPSEWVKYFETLNMSLPKLPRDIIEDDTEIKERIEIQEMWEWREHIRLILKDSLILENENPKRETKHEYWEFKPVREELAAVYDKDNIFVGSPTGLPQGGGISPCLSVQVLKPIFDNNDAIMYADDGIIFHEPVLENPAYRAAGIHFNYEKSGYIKKNGIWLKNLKFCGLVYDREGNLWSETRSGKYLKIDKTKLDKIVYASEWYAWEGTNKRSYTWLEALDSRLGGFIQAALYSGTFDLSSTEANWNVSASKKSWYKSRARIWACKNNAYKISLYNASTLASNWLLNKIRRIKRDTPKKFVFPST